MLHQNHYVFPIYKGIIIFICLFCFLALFTFPSVIYADGGFPIVGVLHAGDHPEAMAVDTQTHMLYIAYETSGLIVEFDPTRSKVRWRVSLGSSAIDLQVDSTSHHVYASVISSHNRESNLFILDGATGHTLATLPVGTGEHSIAFDANRHRIYVANQDNGIIYVFTYLSGWQEGPIRMQSSQLRVGSHPTAIGVNSRLGRLYVADGLQPKMAVIDENSGHIITTIQVGELPLAPLRVDEATGKIFVVCSTGQELDIINGNTNQVIARTPVAPYPEGVAINTATGRIYVADEGNKEGSSNKNVGDTITVIDGQTFDKLGTLQIGLGPDGVEADPALHLIYIAVEDTGAVVELSDSMNLPLKPDATVRQTLAARQAASLLQQATMVTLIAMLLTIVGATLTALLQRWRVRESLQTPPVGASSRSDRHILHR